jgi:hypothetical protein
MWGVFFVALGLLFLAEEFGALPKWADDLKWWGLIVSAIGVGMLIRPRHANDVGDAVTFLLLGGWFTIVTNGWIALTWGNSWPMALVAIGAGTMARAIASRWLPEKGRHRRREERHV